MAARKPMNDYYQEKYKHMDFDTSIDQDDLEDNIRYQLDAYVASGHSDQAAMIGYIQGGPGDPPLNADAQKRLMRRYKLHDSS